MESEGCVVERIWLWRWIADRHFEVQLDLSPSPCPVFFSCSRLNGSR